MYLCLQFFVRKFFFTFSRNALISESMSGKKRLLISAAVTPDPKKIEKGYIVRNLCEKLDYIRFSFN